MIKALTSLALTALFFTVGCQENPVEKRSAISPAPSAPTQAAPSVGGQEPASGLQAQLAHHNFVIETVDSQPFSDQNPDGSPRPKPHISFSEWPQVNGKICNNFRGQAAISGESLKMENAALTKMLCLGDLNDLENIFHQMLKAGAKIKVDNRSLTLSGEGHTLVFSLFDHVQ